jgi:hypothetical protein
MTQDLLYPLINQLIYCTLEEKHSDYMDLFKGIVSIELKELKSKIIMDLENKEVILITTPNPKNTNNSE